MKFKTVVLLLAFFMKVSLEGAYAVTGNQFLPEKFPMPKNQLGFEENKGQFNGIDKKAADYVLFKAALPNLNIWITNTGITYQQLKYNYNPQKFNAVIQKHTSVDINSSIESFESYRIDMILKGANISLMNSEASAPIDRGIINYYHAYCPDGAIDVKAYSSIVFKEIYKGIDWHLYTENGNVEYDFIVHPGADPSLINMIYEGNGNIQIDSNNISFTTNIGKLEEGNLLCYQKAKSNFVKSKFVGVDNSHMMYAGAGINGNIASSYPSNCFSKSVSFSIDNYNSAENLIIDPKIVWGTYFGGPAPEHSKSVSSDKGGQIFISGECFDVGFPTQAWGSAYYQANFGLGMWDCVFTSFSKSGVLNWSTYYGGNEEEAPNAILCDDIGHVFVTGSHVLAFGVTSSTFPLQNLTGAFFKAPVLNSANQFLLRFNATTGVREWATMVADGEGRSMAIDNNKNLYLAGSGSASPAVYRTGAFNDSTFAGGFDITLLRFDSLGALTWATNYGGPNYEEALDISIDEVGTVYITGPAEDSLPLYTRIGAYNYSTYTGGFGDGYLLSFNSSGVLRWATYLQGTTQGTNVGCDHVGNIYVAGYGDTLMDGPMPIVNLVGAFNQNGYGGGSNDVSIMKFNDGGVLNWSTYFGGTEMDLVGNFSCGAEMVIDPCDNIYISLSTLSTNPNTLPTITSCNQYVFTGVAMGGYTYMLKLTNTDEIAWATYYGGNGSAGGWGCHLALDLNDELFAVKTVYEPMVQWPLFDLGGGAYFDSVPDFNEDFHIAKFVPIPPTYSLSQVNDTTCNCGSATITLNCGEPNFSYVWSNGSQTLNSNNNTNTITGLSAGTYTVTVTAACGETTSATFNIQNVVTGVNVYDLSESLTISPNPSNGNFIITSTSNIGKFNLKIYDVLGKIVHEENYSSVMQKEINTNLSPGVYFIKLNSDNSTFTYKIIVE